MQKNAIDHRAHPRYCFSQLFSRRFAATFPHAPAVKYAIHPIRCNFFLKGGGRAKRPQLFERVCGATCLSPQRSCLEHRSIVFDILVLSAKTDFFGVQIGTVCALGNPEIMCVVKKCFLSRIQKSLPCHGIRPPQGPSL